MMIGILLILHIILFFLLIISKRKSCCKRDFCNCETEDIFRDVQNIMWKGDQENFDIIINTLIGIQKYFNAKNIFYTLINSNDQMTVISPNENLERDKEIRSFFDKCLASDSLLQKFKLENDTVYGYIVRIDSFNIGVLFLSFSSAIEIEQKGIQILESFSKFICLKQKIEILEEALCKSEIDIETIINNTHEGLIFVDKKGVIERANKKANKFSQLKFEQMIGRQIEDCFKSTSDNSSEFMQEMINFVIENKKVVDNKQHCLLVNNNDEILTNLKAVPIFDMESASVVDGVMIFFKDVDSERKYLLEKAKQFEERNKHRLELQSEVEQRKEVEKALIRSAALASAGTLAAGVAHEYNNINSIIVGNIDVLLKERDLSKSNLDSLRTIKRLTMRGSEITHGLLDFAKGGSNNTDKKEVVSLIDLANSTKELVAREFEKEGILFSFDSANEKKGSYLIFVNPSQIKQAILNIILNARHAMSDRSKKIVSFQVGYDNSTIYLKISDTGHGIPKEDIQRLFSPFFTTKGDYAKEDSQKKFKGTGLGLTVTDMIIRQHGGSIEVDSVLGCGTTFILKFNKIGDGIQKEETEYHLSKEEMDIDEDIEIKDGQNKRILILDDEEELCKLLVNTLLGNGYCAEYTDNGHEALCRHENNPYDLVITDIQMPKMSGAEFLNKLTMVKGVCPKRIVMTGRVNKKDLDGVLMDEFIYKPFNLFDLMNKIQLHLGL